MPRAAADDAGLTECETCYEDRICDVDVPFTLLSPPRESMPLLPSSGPSSGPASADD